MREKMVKRTIYLDPITETQIEDKARLLRKVGEIDDLEMWEVEFEDGIITTRTIKKDTKRRAK